jgi:hypothetical protein
MSPEQVQNLDQYLMEHGQKAKLSRILAEICETLDGSCDTDALCTQLKLQCAEAVYKQKITVAPKDFVAGDDPYPRIKSRGMFPVGHGPSAQTIYNRKNPIAKIYKQLGSDQPICVDGCYAWLTDVAAVVAALQSCYTVKSTRELAQLSLLQCCEALGQPELQQKYFEALAKLEALPEPERKVLTKPQVAEIRRKNGALCSAALKVLKQQSITGPELTTIYDCLSILTMYGSDKKWEPLRRADWVTIKFRGPNTDLTKANYLSTGGNIVVLTLNYGAKVQELTQAVNINISQCCPRLAKLLLALRPHVEIIQNSQAPYVFCMRDGSAMTPGCFSQRLPGIWQRLGLSFEIPKQMTGLNGARHCSVAEDRKRRKLTSGERADEATQAKNRLSSVQQAETVYG